MAIKKNGKYYCSFCNKEFNNPNDADKCLFDHNLSYLPLTIEQLDHLIKFYYTRQEKYIDYEVVKKLKSLIQKAVARTNET